MTGSQSNDAKRPSLSILVRERQKRIAKFEQQQLRSRKWISFAEIIDWRSSIRSGGFFNTAVREAVLHDLNLDIAAEYHFWEAGQSRILVTSPLYRVSRLLLSDPFSLGPLFWMTSERWRTLRQISEDGARNELMCCWIPRAVCLRWAANVPFELKPEWLPDAKAPTAPSSKRLTSGAPGRPTSMHLVEAEFRRRLEAGLAAAANGAESEILAEWLRTTHKNQPRLTPKTIRNKLGSLRRSVQFAQK